MKVTVDQATFARGLRMLSRVIPARTTLPILQTVLMIAEPGRLIMRASNVELSLATALAANVESPGQVAVPAQTLTEWVAELPAQPISLEADSATGRLRARSGRFRAQVAAQPAEEFPTLPAADHNTALDVEAAALHGAISRVVFAAAADDRRPVLATVRVTLGGNAIGLAACDGFRLALACAPGGETSDEQFLVPARAMIELAHLLDGADKARLLIAPERRALHFLAGSSTLTALLVEGTYPDVEKLVPTDSKTRVTVARAELQRAVQAARLFGTATAGHPVLLETAPGRLEVRARGDERGNVAGAVGATTVGDCQRVCLNGRLLAEVLEAASSPEVVLHWEHAHAPVVVRECDTRHDDSLSPDLSPVWLLMPLKDSAMLPAEPEAARAA